MPRRRRPQEETEHERLVCMLLGNPWALLDDGLPELAGVPDEQRLAAVAEAERILGERNGAERERELRRRLREWPPERWGEIECERPDLVREARRGLAKNQIREEPGAVEIRPRRLHE